MKTYEEMIEITIREILHGNLKYQKWVAVIMLAETYEKHWDDVIEDLDNRIIEINRLDRADRKKRQQEENEARRVANLIVKGTKHETT